MRTGAIVVFALLLLACVFTACGGGSTPATAPGNESPPSSLAENLPDLSALPDPQTAKAVSVIRNMQLDFCGHTGNAVVSPTSVQLPSAATEASAAWWGLTLSYQVSAGPDIYLPVPYLAPYDVTITNNGGGEFWVALPDYKNDCWNILPDTYSGAEVTIPVGLEPNAGNLAGTFWIAIITFGGDDVTISDIAMEFPEPVNNIMANPIEYHQFIEAEDGTRLATTIFLPYQESIPILPDPPYPAVLFRTPYDINILYNTQFEGTSLYKALADLNVVMIAQYHRGRLNDSGDWPDSEGTETLFREHNGPEHIDAIDTVDWIENRHWYNGTLVLSGPSALGLWIYQAAPGLSERLAGIYPQVSAGNVATWAAIRNGCFKRSNVEGWILGNSYPPALLAEAEANYLDDAYWNALDFDSEAASVTCPGYHESGWWDVDVEATIHSWQELQNNGGSGAAGNQWLVLGPWSHDTMRSATVGELSFPTTPASNDPRTVPDAWDGLQWAMKPLGRNPLFSEPSNNVLAYFIGSDEPAYRTVEPNNHWYELAEWPPAYSEYVLYLQDDSVGLVDLNPAAGTLDWQCNPANPVLTNGGNNLPGGPITAGPYDQAFAETHPDVLTFRSAMLGEAVSIGGPIMADLFVATAATDTDIMVKLIDQYPDGRQLLVADTALRLSWHLEEIGAGEVVPGTEYELQFEIGERAYVFEAGHLIGIDIQSTNYPRFDINPGNGDPFYDETNGVLQTNTLEMGGSNPSRVVLPAFDPSA